MAVARMAERRSRRLVAVRMAAVGAVLALGLGVGTTGKSSDGAGGPAVRVAVQVLTTPADGPTGKWRAEVPRVLRVGERFTAFLGAGGQGDLSLVGGGEVLTSVDGFDHRWQVEVGVADAGTNRIVLDVAWRRLGDGAWGRHAAVTLREDEEHVIDLVASHTASDSPAANALVRVAASLSNVGAGPAPLLEYELWLVHEVPERAPRIERVTAAARSSELLPYHFRPLHWALSGEALDERSLSSIQIDVGGSLRGRVREDGTLDVELRTARRYRWGEADAGGGGTKTFSMRPDETVAVQLPGAAGVAQRPMWGAAAGGRSAAGVTVGSERGRVDFAQFFVRHRSTVFLTVREVR